MTDRLAPAWERLSDLFSFVPWERVLEGLQTTASLVAVLVGGAALFLSRRQFLDQAAATERRERSEYYGLIVRNTAIDVVRELGNFLTDALDPSKNPPTQGQLELDTNGGTRARIKLVQERVGAAREEALVGAEAWEDPELIQDLNVAFENLEDAAVEETARILQEGTREINRIRRALGEILRVLKRADPALEGVREPSPLSRDAPDPGSQERSVHTE